MVPTDPLDLREKTPMLKSFISCFFSDHQFLFQMLENRRELTVMEKGLVESHWYQDVNKLVENSRHVSGLWWKIAHVSIT